MIEISESRIKHFKLNKICIKMIAVRGSLRRCVLQFNVYFLNLKMNNSVRFIHNHGYV